MNSIFCWFNMARVLAKESGLLPGGWIQYNESIDESATRILKDLTGVSNVYLEQLKVFGDVNRYPTKRVITIAYYALVKPENYTLHAGFTATDAKWFKISEVPAAPLRSSKDTCRMDWLPET